MRPPGQLQQMNPDGFHTPLAEENWLLFCPQCLDLDVRQRYDMTCIHKRLMLSATVSEPFPPNVQNPTPLPSVARSFDRHFTSERTNIPGRSRLHPARSRAAPLNGRPLPQRRRRVGRSVSEQTSRWLGCDAPGDGVSTAVPTFGRTVRRGVFVGTDPTTHNGRRFYLRGLECV